MKKFYFLFLLFLISVGLECQIPQKISYQAVIRNASGDLVKSSNVGIKISILQGSQSGKAIYIETHFKTTNENGLLSIEIGGGTPVTGTFSEIDWSSGIYFLKTETDVSGGTNYTILGTNQLLGVPYSLYSLKAANGFSGNYLDLTNKPANIINLENAPVFGDLLFFNGTKWITLPIGNEGQILTVKSGLPSWQNQQTISITGPIVNTSAATEISALAAVLNGYINANNLPTTVTFEYGATNSYGHTVTADQSPITGLANTPVSCSINGLKTGTTYHYRVKAVNSVSTSYGVDVTFTTPIVGFASTVLVDSSVSDMYKAARLGFYTFNNTERGYPFGAASIEQGDCRGEDAVNLQAFFQITYEGTYNPTTLNNLNIWSNCYRLINRCNIVIDSVKYASNNGIISSQKALQYEGEARFLRALSYHELLIHFARPYLFSNGASHPGVPIHEKLISTQNSEMLVLSAGRSTVADVYSKILNDLNFAEVNLPKKSSLTGNAKIVRLTSEAAIALKTRIYLHMCNWVKVIDEGQKLIGMNSYSLTASPDEPFINNYTNTESIFSFENTSQSNPGVNGSLAALYNGKGRALVCISPIIWRNSLWLADDKRRGVTMTYTSAQNGIIFSNKYKDYNFFTDATPIIRYAEVFLNMAEAHSRTGDFAAGLTYLNSVRNRSLSNPSIQAYNASSFVNNTALLAAILIERRIEFCMEGRRWADIHRLQLDIPAKVSNSNPPSGSFNLGTEYNGPYGIAAIPYLNYKFLWPVPQIEINADPSYSTLQNPGW